MGWSQLHKLGHGFVSYQKNEKFRCYTPDGDAFLFLPAGIVPCSAVADHFGLSYDEAPTGKNDKVLTYLCTSRGALKNLEADGRKMLIDEELERSDPCPNGRAFFPRDRHPDHGTPWAFKTQPENLKPMTVEDM